MIYGLLDKKDSHQLHDVGFKFEKRPFKLFTFAWIEGGTRPAISKDKIVFTPPLRLTVSSPLEYILSQIAENALKRDSLRLGDNCLECTAVRVEEPLVTEREVFVRTLSPITCYSTLYQLNGTPYTVYHDPREEKFQEQIYRNLAKKFCILYPDRFLSSEKVTFQSIDEPRLQVARFSPKNTLPIKGWWGQFLLRGPQELLQIGVDAGLGAKNSSGWGCVAIVPHKRESERRACVGIH